jgi:hypothetical protein
MWDHFRKEEHLALVDFDQLTSALFHDWELHISFYHEKELLPGKQGKLEPHLSFLNVIVQTLVGPSNEHDLQLALRHPVHQFVTDRRYELVLVFLNPFVQCNRFLHFCSAQENEEVFHDQKPNAGFAPTLF